MISVCTVRSCRHAQRVFGSFMFFVVVATCAVLNAAESPKRSFDVPAGVAEQTLKLFSEQSGQSMVIGVASVKGVRTNAVRGELPVREALARLLAGTGLVATHDEKGGAFTVKREDADPNAPRTATAAPAASRPAPEVRPAPTQPAADGESVFELSPFRVEATRDRGYAATSTLSGTRLNTAVRDTAATLSILTSDAIRDIGYTNVQDLAVFIPSTEKDTQGYNSANNNAGGIRVRGVTINSTSVNFFPLFWRLDSYNLDRVTQNRGSNSLLFGTGNPTGFVTGSTLQANPGLERRTSGRFEARWDSEGTERAQLEVNHVLMPKRLALRLAAVDTDEKSFRNFTRWDEQRVFLTATARLLDRPNFKTTLRAEGEYAQADRLLPQPRTAFDGLYAWIANGRPLLNGVQPATATAVLPAGTVRAIATNSLVVIGGNTAATIPPLNWINTGRGADRGTFRYRLEPASAVPYENNFFGDFHYSNYHGKWGAVFLEQQLGRNLVIEVSHFDHSHDLEWVRPDPNDPIAQGSQVSVDVNATLPNGQPNPNAGRFYVEGVPMYETNYREARETRATVAYDLDLKGVSRWLGTHRLAGMVNQLWEEYAADTYREVNLTPLPGFPASPAANLVVRRTYLGNGTDAALQGFTPHTLPPVNSGGVQSGFRRNQGAQHPGSATKGWTLGVQSKLLLDRLVGVYGHRHDTSSAYGPVANPADANGFRQAWREIPLAKTLEQEFDTQTLGLVAHVLPQLSLTYNKSEVVSLASAQLSLDGSTLPVPLGKTEDYGIKFSLFGQRLVGSLVRFDSGTRHGPRFNFQAARASFNLISAALNRPQIAVNPNAVDTGDTDVRGYELELVFNPTPKLRLALNAAKNENLQTNVNARFGRYVEQNILPLIGTPQENTLLSNGRTLLAEFNTNIRNEYNNNYLAQNNRPAAEIRKWTGSLLANYAFRNTRLDGLEIGGWASYRGRGLLGLQIVNGVIDVNQPYYGNDYWILGAHVRYERPLRFGRDQRWFAELRVTNLLDYDDLILTGSDFLTRIVTQFNIPEPRKFIVSAGVKF